MDISKNDTGFLVGTKTIDIALDSESKKANVVLSSSPGRKVGEGVILFDGAGEYEVKNVMIDGFELENKTTAFAMSSDDIRVAFIPQTETLLSDSAVEIIDGVDVLIVPTIGAKGETTNKIISQLEPKIVIPYGYDKEQLAQMSAEFGSEHETLTKIKLTRKDLNEDTQKLVVLE